MGWIISKIDTNELIRRSWSELKRFACKIETRKEKKRGIVDEKTVFVRESCG